MFFILVLVITYFCKIASDEIQKYVSKITLRWTNTQYNKVQTVCIMRQIQCTLDILQSFFFDQLTKDTLELARKGKVCGVAHECKVWQKFCYYNCWAACIIVLYMTKIYRESVVLYAGSLAHELSIYIFIVWVPTSYNNNMFGVKPLKPCQMTRAIIKIANSGVKW